MDTVDVLLTGKLLADGDLDRAAAALARMTGLPQDRARELLTSSKPRLAKRGLTLEEAKVFVDRFTELGIETALRPGEEKSPPRAAPAPVPPAGDPVAADEAAEAADMAVPNVAAARDGEGGPPGAPAWGSHEPAVPNVAAARDGESGSPGAPAWGTPEPDEGDQVNPYAPPKAEPSQAPPHGGEGGWSGEPAEVSGMRGIEWIREAWELFRAHPKIWIGPLAAAALLYFIVALWPRGGIVLSLVLPVLAGGVVTAAHRLAGGEEAEAGNVNPYADLRVVRALVNITLFCTLYQAIFLLILFIILGPKTLSGGVPHLGPAGLLLGLSLFALFLAPQYLFSLFGPSLAALGGMGAIDAMKAALRGGLKNRQTILLNALITAIATMLPLLPLMALAGLMGGSVIVVGLLSAVFFAPLWCFFTLMSYFASRDIFHEEY